MDVGSGGWSPRTWRIAVALALTSGIAVGTFASAQRAEPEPGNRVVDVDGNTIVPEP